MTPRSHRSWEEGNRTFEVHRRFLVLEDAPCPLGTGTGAPAPVVHDDQER